MPPEDGAEVPAAPCTVAEGAGEELQAEEDGSWLDQLLSEEEEEDHCCSDEEESGRA